MSRGSALRSPADQSLEDGRVVPVELAPGQRQQQENQGGDTRDKQKRENKKKLPVPRITENELPTDEASPHVEGKGGWPPNPRLSHRQSNGKQDHPRRDRHRGEEDKKVYDPREPSLPLARVCGQQPHRDSEANGQGEDCSAP